MKILFCISIAVACAIQLALGGATTTTTLPLVNGDFETGPYDTIGNVAGWTVSGNGKILSATQGATSGTHSAAFSATGDSQGNVLSQSFFTTPGRVYSLDFDAGMFGMFTGDPLQLHFQVIGNSSLLDDYAVMPLSGQFNTDRVTFGHYHYTFTADSAVTTLQFTDIGMGNAAGDIELDTVSVAMHVTTGVPTYTFKDLGTLGGTTSGASGIDPFGRVVGGAGVTASSGHAFLSAPGGGQLTDLGTLGGSFSGGNAVNTLGQVTGSSSFAGGGNSSHAFLSAPNGGALTDLGTLGGNSSEGWGVNDSGQVTGNSNLTQNGPVHAFLSGPSGGTPLHDLGTFGGMYSLATGVNASGRVAGTGYFSDNSWHAFLSDPNGGALNDLGTLGGLFSVGQAVNDSGQVTGNSNYIGDKVNPFLSGPNGRNLLDLNPLGPRLSYGYGLNSCGQVVGFYYDDQTEAPHAFIYNSTGGTRDLNTIMSPATAFFVRQPNAINDQGQITGYGYYNNNTNVSRAFLLTPNLGIERADSTNVTLFWPGSCSGPNVQQATSLSPTANWQAVTAQPTIVDGTDSFTVSSAPDNGPHFYRLTFNTGNQTQAVAIGSGQQETIRSDKHGRKKD